MACDDVVACLNHLTVAKAHVLFMCAGAPYAMKFCTRYPARCHGPIYGLSCWVSPVDCPMTSWFYRMGAALRNTVSSSAEGDIASACQPFARASSCISTSWLDGSNNWVLEESSGQSDDILVCLQSAVSWGVDYGTFPHDVVLVHGSGDDVVPLEAARWLSHQLPGGHVWEQPGGHVNVMDSMLHSAAWNLAHGNRPSGEDTCRQC